MSISGRETALVVDDDPTTRRVLEALLGRAGLSVVTANDGRDGVDTFLREKIDVVFMDVEMPILDGIDAARIIKDGCRDRFVPIIFLTGRTDDHTLERCLEGGGDDFLSKPINPVVLVTKLEALLRIRDLSVLVGMQRAELDVHRAETEREQQIAEWLYASLVKWAGRDLENVRLQLSPLSLLEGELLLVDRARAGDIRVLIGDFAGRGLSAVMGAPRVCEAFHEMTARGESIAEIARDLNQILCRVLPADVFMACCILDVDMRQGELKIWNGGIPDVLVRATDGGIRHRGRSTDLPRGVARNEERTFSSVTTPIHSGDRVLASSDRAVSAFAGGGTPTEQRLEVLYADSDGKRGSTPSVKPFSSTKKAERAAEA